MACETQAWMQGALFGVMIAMFAWLIIDTIRWNRRQRRLEARLAALEDPTDA